VSKPTANEIRAALTRMDAAVLAEQRARDAYDKAGIERREALADVVGLIERYQEFTGERAKLTLIKGRPASA
jgi:hypothetical protein